jgi:hypothetical protein
MAGTTSAKTRFALLPGHDAVRGRQLYAVTGSWLCFFRRNASAMKLIPNTIE